VLKLKNPKVAGREVEPFRRKPGSVPG
jgi:hypothetical protein